jgi:hypothetical protein
MGFASAPGILRVLVFVPVVGDILAIGGSLWRLVATIIAVRPALDFSTWRAILTTIVGWFVYMVLLSLMRLLANGTAPSFL